MSGVNIFPTKMCTTVFIVFKKVILDGQAGLNQCYLEI